MISLLLTLILSPTLIYSTPVPLSNLTPIYLGEVFWPPSMTFLAWIPSPSLSTSASGNTVPADPLEWCVSATDASNLAVFSLAHPELGTIDALQLHDYFSTTSAYVTREGKRFAECFITPESVRMGTCDGIVERDCEGGHKFAGPGHRKWTCWIREEEARRFGNGTERWGGMKAGNLGMGAGLTTGTMEAGSVFSKATGAVGSEAQAAFTPGVTGR